MTEADTFHCTECADFNTKFQDSVLEPRRLQEWHKVDRAPRKFQIGDTVTVPAEKCPCCDDHHGITDWTGTIESWIHPMHVSALFGDDDGPFYGVTMADGKLVYSEHELVPENVTVAGSGNCR